MASPDVGNIKGAPLCEFLGWYAAEVDQVLLERVLRELAEDGLAPFDVTRARYGVLASVWYPAGTIHRLMDRLFADVGEQRLFELAGSAAEFIMHRTLRGVYKAMFSMFATPERYARHVPKLWAQHYDTGRPVVRNMGPNAHHIMHEDWRGHHRFICRMNMASATPIYRAMGCEGVTWERLSCVSFGGAECASVVRWTRRT
jgi:hypothetical protein